MGLRCGDWDWASTIHRDHNKDFILSFNQFSFIITINMLLFIILISLVVIPFSYFLYKIDDIRIDNMDLLSYAISKIPVGDTYPSNPVEKIKSARVTRLKAQGIIIEPLFYFKDPALRKVQFEDIIIPAGDNQSINVRLYNHDNASHASRRKKKVLVYYHGGGWIIGSAKENHILTAQIAKESEYLVVSVDYRLAPEHVFPAAVNDAYAGLEWVIEHIGEYGGDPSFIILSGESAGGNLAAAVTSRHLINHARKHCAVHDEKDLIEGNTGLRECLTSSDRLRVVRGLWLIYPPLTETSFSQEALRYDKVSNMLSTDKMEWLRRIYQGGANETNLELRRNYSFSPIRTPDIILSQYPPTLFTLAKHDVLTAESEEMAAKLRSFGRSATVSIYNSTVHGFVTGHISLGGKAVKEFIQYSENNFT